MRLRDGILKLAGFCVLAGVLMAGTMFPAVGSLGVVSNRASDTVNNLSADLVSTDPPLMTTLLDRDGKPFAYLFEQYRIMTPIEKIPATMRGAIIAVEDRRFYEHQGVDWRGTFRAALANQASGAVSQGGSTLTQQYVKNYLVQVAAQGNRSEQNRATEQTPARKLREIRIALQLEKRMSKDEILSSYLNVVPFGNGTYGLTAAARTYFGVEPEKLSVTQAALLAGIVNSPEALNPVTRPEKALQRRNEVLERMGDAGMLAAKHDESVAVAQKLFSEPLGILNPVKTPPNNCVGAGSAGFFCNYVREYLKKSGFTKEIIERGGFNIKTTLDRQALDKMKAALDAETHPKNPHAATVMSLVQPGKEKHRVVALSSNRVFGLNADEKETVLALPSDVQNLGAGSIYKIFTAAAALERGLGLNTTIPTPDFYVSRVFKTPANPGCPSAGNGQSWYCVKNAGAYGASSMDLRKALARSPNGGFVNLLERAGLPATVDMASKLGLRSLETKVAGEDNRTPKRSIAQFVKDQTIASFTLGPSPTSSLELANVGATLAAEGVWCPPSPIESITDRHGRPVAVREDPCEQVVAPGLANAMMVGLSDDVKKDGTAHAAATAAGWNRPLAAKTGTSQQHKSAGFIGFNQQYAGAVFTFDDTNRPRPLCDGANGPYSCGSGNIYGGKTPAQTWMRAMTGIMAGMPVVEMPPVEPRYFTGGPNVQVPNVVGMQVDKATGTLEQAGYKVVQRNSNSARARGTVVSQSPRGGALPGETITLHVSTGFVPPPTPSPDRPGNGAEPSAPAPRAEEPENPEEPPRNRSPQMPGVIIPPPRVEIGDA